MGGAWWKDVGFKFIKFLPQLWQRSKFRNFLCFRRSFLFEINFHPPKIFEFLKSWVFTQWKFLKFDLFNLILGKRVSVFFFTFWKVFVSFWRKEIVLFFLTKIFVCLCRFNNFFSFRHSAHTNYKFIQICTYIKLRIFTLSIVKKKFFFS